MKKRLHLAIVALVVMWVIFAVGLIFIFSAPTIGERMGHQAIVRAGGSMDTAIYQRIASANTTAFNTAGLALTLVGGLGFIVSGSAAYRELD